MSEENKPSGGSEWGEDWEAAFQAEDDLFFPDPEEPPAEAGEAPAADAAVADSAGAPPPEPEQEGTEQEAAEERSGFSALLWILAGAGSGLVLTLTILGLYLMLNDAPEEPPPARPVASVPPAGTAPAPPPQATTAAPLPNRVKIALRPFLIPVRRQPGKPLRELLDLEVTLVVELDDSAKEISREDRIRIRDSIYRLFISIPSSELHHYTLARGEMVTRTMDAIRKSLPNLTVKSLIFDRYHIL